MRRTYIIPARTFACALILSVALLAARISAAGQGFGEFPNPAEIAPSDTAQAARIQAATDSYIVGRTFLTSFSGTHDQKKKTAVALHAIACFQQSIHLYPTKIAHVGLASAYFVLGDADNVHRTVEQGIALHIEDQSAALSFDNALRDIEKDLARLRSNKKPKKQ